MNLQDLKTELERLKSLQQEMVTEYRKDRENAELKQKIIINRGYITETESKINQIELKQEVDCYNTFQDDIKAITDALREYDGKIFKVSKLYTKAFDKFLQSIPDELTSEGFTFWLTYKGYSSAMLQDEINLNCKKGNFTKQISYVDGLPPYYEPNYANYDKMLQARRECEALRIKLEEAKHNFKSNMNQATHFGVIEIHKIGDRFLEI